MLLNHKSEFHEFVNELTQLMGLSNPDDVAGQLLDVWIGNSINAINPINASITINAFKSTKAKGRVFLKFKVSLVNLNFPPKLNLNLQGNGAT